jgi:stage II sporulation protein D
MALDRYVVGVVAGELAVGALDPAIVGPMLELQAILSRTYATANLGRHRRDGFDVCATTHCQVVRPEAQILAANRGRIEAAVARTHGQILVFEGRPIQALFHSSCGGRTSAADAIWGGAARPYLQPVRDEWCETDPAAAWSFSVTREEARAALGADPKTAVGGRLDAVTVLERDGSGRAVLVAVDGERSPLVRGEELRAVLVRRFGDRSIRSPRFDVIRDGDRLRFSGRGRGHGAGLCQAGAMARLRGGASAVSVLAAYFAGARLTPPLPAARPSAGTSASAGAW